MKRTMGGLVILATATVFGVSELSAQRGPDGPRGFANRGRDAGVEAIMQMRTDLELSDDQIQELDVIRQEAVQLRNADQAEMMELTSRFRAGEIERDAVRDAMEARAEARREATAQQRERVDAILSDTQRETLEETGARARAFERGFAMGTRRGGQRGVQGQRGMRGQRGGFGPGAEQGFSRRRGAGLAPGFGTRMAPGRRFLRGGRP